MALRDFLLNLPEVAQPTEKRVAFNKKLKWTLAILGAFFLLANIPLYGLAENALAQFEYLAMILGTEFGSIISLGIGPIVMASIILQLLVGGKLLDIDLTKPEGKRIFQGLQKVLALFFCLFEAIVYVLMGGLQAMPGMTSLVIFQLFLGGLLIVYMDEVVSKYGFGSGVGLFIAGGVGWRLFTQAFSPLTEAGVFAIFTDKPVIGKVWVFLNSVARGAGQEASAAFFAIATTVVIFLIVVFTQGIRVEVPLSFGRLRGFGVKWPLSFFYTSVIPVILASALIANLQLFTRLLQSWAGRPTFLGGFTPDGTAFGPIAWLSLANLPYGILDSVARGYFEAGFLLQGLVYAVFLIGCATLFSVFWMKTSGMDASSQARQILASGLQIPGFRRDPRVLEVLLGRYILPLTVMGGAAVGALAAAADLLGALVRGTGILLAVMIIYRLYQEIVQQHAIDMSPAFRRLVAG